MYGLNKVEEALDAYNKTIELDSSYVDAYYQKGLILFYDFEKYDEAIEAYLKFVQIKPTAFVYFVLGNALFKLGTIR